MSERPTYRCIGGFPADEDGVCSEHGETACVIGVGVESTSKPEYEMSGPANRSGADRTPGEETTRDLG